MKRTLSMLSITCCMLIATSVMTRGASLNGTPVKHVRNAYDWMKSTTGTWPGMKDGKTIWYKLDDKAGLWWSMDGTKWMMAKKAVWMDKDGKWLKINDKKLVWSTDGKTWSEVPEWKWMGSDGKWYKFDQSWGLWING